MLLTLRVYRECILVGNSAASPISLPFWDSQCISLISLVDVHEDLRNFTFVIHRFLLDKFPVLATRFPPFPQLHGLMASRYRVGMLSPLHLGEGTFTLMITKLSEEELLLLPPILELYSFRVNGSHKFPRRV